MNREEKRFAHSLIPIACLLLGSHLLAAGAEPKDTLPPGTSQQPATKPSGWTFRLEPYGWLMGMDGSVGAGPFSTSVDVSSKSLLQNLDWGVFLQAEARNGKWGILADGFFAQLSAEGNPPGPLYSNLDAKLQQGLGELALAYRVWEGKAGFLDVFAGARYNYISTELDADIDTAGVWSVSKATSERIVKEASARARSAVAQKLAAKVQTTEQEAAVARAGVQTELRADIERRALSEIRALRTGTGVAGTLGTVEAAKLVAGTVKEQAALAKAVTEREVAAARATVRGHVARAVDAAVDRAEKNLAKAIDRELKKRLPQDVADHEQWVDPFIGLRAQWNITQRLYIAARGDIGGFGVSSDLVWQACGTLGYNFNDHLFIEAGYRYLQTDYSDGGFTFDIAQSGAFVGFGLRF